jgi:hypothetical protein
MSDRPPPDEDDDFELELEAVDPEILAHERLRGQQKTDEAIAKVDIDELYKKPENFEYDVEWSKLRQFKFTTRHLLILTAVLAFGLTLKMTLGGCMALFVAALLAIAAGWYAVVRVERREAAERERRRREFDAARAASPIAVAQGASVWIEESRPPRPEFRFAFSLKQVFITMTVAAVMLGMLLLAGPKALVITLGVLSLVGLAVQTFGWFDPPPGVVFGWWMLLMLYLALGLLTAFFPNLMSVDRAPTDPGGSVALYRDC